MSEQLLISAAREREDEHHQPAEAAVEGHGVRSEQGEHKLLILRKTLPQKLLSFRIKGILQESQETSTSRMDLTRRNCLEHNRLRRLRRSLL
jgi:hypothetical protein